MEFTWEEPPPPRSQSVGDEIAAELRKYPGKWARLGPGMPMTASNIKRGRPKAFEPAGAFEAVSRVIEGETIIYARYLGS